MRRLGCGKDDLAYDLCQDTRGLLDKYRVPYIYVEGTGLHNWETAQNALFVFVTLLFREAT